MATRLCEVDFLGRARGAAYVRHLQDDTVCVHSGSPQGRFGDLRLWFWIHSQTLRELERDLARWEVRLMLRLADPDADMALMAQMSRFRLSSLRVGAERIEQAIPRSASDQERDDFVRRVDTVVQRLHRGFELLATGAAGRMVEIERENSRRGEQLTKTVTIMTCVFLAPSLVAAVTDAVLPGSLKSFMTIVLAGFTSVFLTLAFLPGPQSFLGNRFKVFAVGAVGTALICILTSMVVFRRDAPYLAYADLALGLSVLILLGASWFRSRRQAPNTRHIPRQWLSDYERLRNDLQRPGAAESATS